VCVDIGVSSRACHKLRPSTSALVCLLYEGTTYLPQLSACCMLLHACCRYACCCLRVVDVAWVSAQVENVLIVIMCSSLVLCAGSTATATEHVVHVAWVMVQNGYMPSAHWRASFVEMVTAASPEQMSPRGLMKALGAWHKLQVGVCLRSVETLCLLVRAQFCGTQAAGGCVLEERGDAVFVGACSVP